MSERYQKTKDEMQVGDHVRWKHYGGAYGGQEYYTGATIVKVNKVMVRIELTMKDGTPVMKSVKPDSLYYERPALPVEQKKSPRVRVSIESAELTVNGDTVWKIERAGRNGRGGNG